MNSNAMLESNLAGYSACRETMLYLSDGCMYEPIDLLNYPPVDPTKQEKLAKVAANNAALTTNKINVVDNSVVKNVLLPATAAEKDVFVLVNQTPQSITLKAATADVNAIATVRGGAIATFRYLGGKWTQF